MVLARWRSWVGGQRRSPLTPSRTSLRLHVRHSHILVASVTLLFLAATCALTLWLYSAHPWPDDPSSPSTASNEPFPPPFHSPSSFARSALTQASWQSHEELVYALDDIPFMQRRMRRGLDAKWATLSQPSLLPLWQPLIGRSVLVLLGPTIAEMQHKLDKGGPSGDFVQWADVLSVLALVQADVELVLDRRSVKTVELATVVNASLLLMDYNSLWLFHERVDRLQAAYGNASLWDAVSCRVRVLDFFGSEDWSLERWFHSVDADLHQVWTAFPYLPNNTFLGFAVMPVDLDNRPSPYTCNPPSPPPVKADQAMLWGKDYRYYFDDSKHNALSNVSLYLSVIRRAFGNDTRLLTSLDEDDVYDTPGLQDIGAQSLGPVSAVNFSAVVRQSRALIGIGAPIDGISWLEALAEGTPFINPRMPRPFTAGQKPHRRLYASQVQYAESLGEPYVYNLHDSLDEAEVRGVVERLRAQAMAPYTVPDFCVDAFVERVVRLVAFQGFCQVQRHREGAECRCPYCSSCHWAHMCVCGEGEAEEGEAEVQVAVE